MPSTHAMGRPSNPQLQWLSISGAAGVPGVQGQLPESRQIRSENKMFYFDVGQNNRGVFLRISEVRSLFRCHFTRSYWFLFSGEVQFSHRGDHSGTFLDAFSGLLCRVMRQNGHSVGQRRRQRVDVE